MCPKLDSPRNQSITGVQRGPGRPAAALHDEERLLRDVIIYFGGGEQPGSEIKENVRFMRADMSIDDVKTRR